MVTNRKPSIWEGLTNGLEEWSCKVLLLLHTLLTVVVVVVVVVVVD